MCCERTRLRINTVPVQRVCACARLCALCVCARPWIWVRVRREWMYGGDRGHVYAISGGKECSRVAWWAPSAFELRTAIRCQQRRGPRRGGEGRRGDGERPLHVKGHLIFRGGGGGCQAAQDRSPAVCQVLVEQDRQQIVMLLLQGLKAVALILVPLLLCGGRRRGGTKGPDRRWTIGERHWVNRR